MVVTVAARIGLNRQVLVPDQSQARFVDQGGGVESMDGGLPPFCAAVGRTLDADELRLLFTVARGSKRTFRGLTGTDRFTFYLIVAGTGFRANLTPADFDLDEAGPEYADFHALRHSYLTLCGRSGIDLRTLQELFGHSTLVLTAHYSHRRSMALPGQ
jgi:hypothetical protein